MRGAQRYGGGVELWLETFEPGLGSIANVHRHAYNLVQVGIPATMEGGE